MEATLTLGLRLICKDWAWNTEIHQGPSLPFLLRNIMASTRTGYVALPTPDSSDFNIPYTTSAPSSRQSDVTQGPGSGADLRGDSYGQRWRLQATWTRMQDIARNNNGLLLVAASQVFLSLMNLAVKILNDIDPPVSTFEVCPPFRVLPFIYLTTHFLVNCCANGVCLVVNV